MPAGGGAVMLPVVGGSASGADAGGRLAVVSDFDLKTSPSLVEVSQPLSQSRQAAVAIRTRPALPPIGVFPRRPSGRFSPPRREARTRRSGAAITKNRPG